MADAIEYAPNLVYQAILAARVLIDVMPAIIALPDDVAAA